MGKRKTGGLLLRLTEALPKSWSIQGRVATRVRLEGEILRDAPEHRPTVERFANGLHSREGFSACNAQELVFTATLVRAHAKWRQDLMRGVRPSDAPGEFSLVDYILEDVPDDEKHQEYVDCAQALFEVLVAAMLRENIVYMPVADNSLTSKLVQQLLHRGMEVLPKQKRLTINLPEFEVRYVGIPGDEIDEQD
jgi:hypothetical protein